MAKTEHEWARRAARHLESQMKRNNVTNETLAERLKAHGFSETGDSISDKLARAAIPAAFFLASLAVMELTGVQLQDL